MAKLGGVRIVCVTLAWLLLIGMAYWTLVESPRVTTLLALLFGVCSLVALLIVILSFAFTRETRRFATENDEACAALARGELQRAHDVFAAWAKRARYPAIAAFAHHNVGWTLLRQGKLQEAVDALADNDEHRADGLKSTALYPTTAVDLALAHALLGNLDDATSWLAKAESREGEPRQQSYPAMKAFSRAIIGCRSGRPADAARMLDERWNEYEAALNGGTLRPLRILRAFAVAAADLRDAGRAEAALATTRPAYPGEFDFLAVAWPEMAMFLAAHQLARSAAASQAE